MKNLRNVAAAASEQPLQLRARDHAPPGIGGAEELPPQRAAVLLGHRARDDRQQRPLRRWRPHEGPKRGEQGRIEGGRAPSRAGLQPRVLQRGAGAGPCVRVHDQQPPQEVLSLSGMAAQARRELHLARLDLGHDLLLAAAEQRHADQEHVGNDPERPNIGLLGVRAGKNLGRHVIDRAASLLHPGVRTADAPPRQAEVDQLQVAGALGLENIVLQLQIAVRYVVRMQIHHRQQHLLNQPGSRILAQATAVPHPGQQLATGEILHDEVQLRRRLVHVVQPGDVRVVD
mmetsp:Transcript_56069/g.170728  ORF Transcript_56069/g.170728 Transcript_56069/m.170728 type:complete len:287 (+) Transcript_56069:477-1337(+)